MTMWSPQYGIYSTDFYIWLTGMIHDTRAEAQAELDEYLAVHPNDLNDDLEIRERPDS